MDKYDWTDVDLIALDNSDPPQLWAWNSRGDKTAESAEPLFAITGWELAEQLRKQQAEIERLRAFWQWVVTA
jgi:hypothetical protein